MFLLPSPVLWGEGLGARGEPSANRNANPRPQPFSLGEKGARCTRDAQIAALFIEAEAAVFDCFEHLRQRVVDDRLAGASDLLQA